MNKFGLFIKSVVVALLIFVVSSDFVNAAVTIKVKGNLNHDVRACGIMYKQKNIARLIGDSNTLFNSTTRECVIKDADIEQITSFNIAGSRYDKEINLNGCNCVNFYLNKYGQLKLVCLEDLDAYNE